MAAGELAGHRPHLRQPLRGRAPPAPAPPPIGASSIPAAPGSHWLECVPRRVTSSVESESEWNSWVTPRFPWPSVDEKIVPIASGRPRPVQMKTMPSCCEPRTGLVQT